jgi:Fur family transcriptional regulator, ferric uptake regulator
MSCERETAEGLRTRGRRFTVQRLKVAAALRHSGGHCTAEEIHEIVSREDPHAGMPLSTVYRTLGTLKELRLVAELDAGGRAAYEWVELEQPHHHLICQRCGAEQDLNRRLPERLCEEILAETGFEAYLDHLSLAGRCANCRSSESPA